MNLDKIIFRLPYEQGVIGKLYKKRPIRFAALTIGKRFREEYSEALTKPGSISKVNIVTSASVTNDACVNHPDSVIFSRKAVVGATEMTDGGLTKKFPSAKANRLEDLDRRLERSRRGSRR